MILYIRHRALRHEVECPSALDFPTVLLSTTHLVGSNNLGPTSGPTSLWPMAHLAMWFDGS